MLKRILPLLILFFYFHPSHSEGKDSLYFCEDYKDGKEIGVSKVFNIPAGGGKLTVMIRLGSQIGVSSVNLEIYKITGGDEELVETDPWDVDKDWDYIYFSYVTFKKPGNYRVACTHKNGLEIVSGFIKINYKE
jgi:hypothetical protein